MTIVLLAAACMFVEDIVGTVMMQFESNSLNLPRRRRFRDYVGGGWRAWMSAWCDEIQWTVGITTTTISVEAFGGHDLGRKAAVFLAVSAANILGSRTGQELGIWLLRRRGKEVPQTIEERIAELESRVAHLGTRGQL